MTRVAALMLAFLAATPAVAAQAEYAMQWTVRPSQPDAAAHALTLTPEVYGAVQRADLRDLDVLDADGRPVPADITAPAASASRVERRAPGWYAMPSPRQGTPTDWRVVAELDADGRLRGLRSGAVPDAPRMTSLVLDTGPLPGPGRPRASLAALEVAWSGDERFDRAYLVEGSDDFDGWRELGRGRLVSLHEGSRTLRLGRIELGEGVAQPRYVRLVPVSPETPLPAVDRVQIETAREVEASLHWLVLTPAAETGGYRFELPGRMPVRTLDLEVPGNDARSWRLQSRDGDGRWIDRVDGWAVYRVGARRSPARVFASPVRDRHWRLLGTAGGPAPRLRVGYIPETVTFVAAGRPPYLLVAGSASAMRTPRPVRAAVDTGANRPAPAALGPAQPRAGDAALHPPPDWKRWSLWAVLAVGVLLVGGFALRVLREPASVD